MAIRQDLRILEGETWSFTFTHLGADGSPVDLSNHTARMSVREKHGHALEAFLSTDPSAGQGTITLTETGEVTLAIDAANSADLLTSIYLNLMTNVVPDIPRRVKMVYDVELISSAGVVDRAIEGTVEIQRGVNYE